MDAQFTDMILTIIVLSFWFLFPIGMFLSVSHVDKITDEVVRLDHLRRRSGKKEKSLQTSRRPRVRSGHGQWQVSYRH